MDELLNFDIENDSFNVSLLDDVVAAFYDTSNPRRDEANEVLMALLENPQAWTRVDTILDRSEVPNTKFFALQILQDTIQYRWGTLPKEQREGVRTYIVEKIIELATTEESLHAEHMFVSKLNLSLVTVLKQEWPHNWPSFIPDLVGSSKASQSLCENNMHILKLLSEEVFDFSKDQMTSEKVEHMKKSLNKEFMQIFELCEFVLGFAEQESLLGLTLETLLRFLSWIPLGYIFETKLIETLCVRFLAHEAFRCDALACLTEIGSIDAPSYDEVFVNMYNSVVDVLTGHIAPDADIARLFDDATLEQQTLIQRMSLFFSGFFGAHRGLLEKPDFVDPLTSGMQYLVRISAVPDDQIFKICLEYWHAFTKDLYLEECRFPGGAGGKLLTSGGTTLKSKHLYGEILSHVRLVLISRMAKPEEVLIKETAGGDIIRETTKDTDALAQYKTMREALVYLTHLDYEDTCGDRGIMLTKLARQVDGSEWGFKALNTLCWAVGSISGAMSEEDEKRFVVTVIKDLLRLCEIKRGKKNKAVIASCIMYVVGQYPRFLRKHWKFLRTVVIKLFEFMHERHPGVQDMACDTFLKIANKCKRMFVILQPEESRTFVDELVDQVPDRINDLQMHQIHSFYEAVGCMVGEASNPDVRDGLLDRLMALPNQMWQRLMLAASEDVAALHDPDAAREVQRIVITNKSVCRSVGPAFGSQMGRIFMDMLSVYTAYSNFVAGQVEESGEGVVRMSAIRLARDAKKELLDLVGTFVNKCGNNMEETTEKFIPPFLEAVLTDYANSAPPARDAEVLSTLASIVKRLEHHMSPFVPQICEAVFGATLEMITDDMDDSPEIRLAFYQLLSAFIGHTFEAFFDVPGEQQKLIVDSIMWGIKHTRREIADLGLGMLSQLIDSIVEMPDVADGFFSTHLVNILQDVLFVLTDRMHKSGFKMQTTILRQLLSLVEGDHISQPIWDVDTEVVDPDTRNAEYLQSYVHDLLSTSFEHLTGAQLESFVSGLFDMSRDLSQYKTLVRDFLIELLEFKSDEDTDDLYVEEQQEAQEQLKAMALESAAAVPGLLKPDEIDYDDDL